MQDATAPQQADAAPAPTWPKLTPREAEIATMLARGYRNAEIATILGISIKTIDTHRGHLLDKLDLRCNVALTRYAIRAGLVPGAEADDAPGCVRKR